MATTVDEDGTPCQPPLLVTRQLERWLLRSSLTPRQGQPAPAAAQGHPGM